MATPQEEVQQQAGKIITHVAGYVGVKAIDMGLRLGMLDELAKHPDGVTSDALAEALSLDPFYVGVWCSAAYGAEVLDADGDTFKLAPHMDKLLLDKDFPGYVGGLPNIMVQPELFDTFAKNLPSGKRSWWDECSPEWIEAVSLTARPFYSRLVAGGFDRVPGLSDRLAGEVKIMDLACGAGVGLQKLAAAYPKATLVGVDGDAHSLEVTGQKLKDAGLSDRVSLVKSTFEELDAGDDFDVVIINVSMHECRDIDEVTKNVNRALKPDGYFVISDFPFPDKIEGVRTPPARVMSGIQFFEALIDDQLLPTQAYVDLLNKHGFKNVAAFDMTPVHAVTHGQK
ncbi:MAG: methyltransferase domain-containing protein [Chloroflexi bacterium]|nr:methyltransferase domain-containing protein [Chloroflexota bacterium]